MVWATSWADCLPISISWDSETSESWFCPVTGFRAQPDREAPKRKTERRRGATARRGVMGEFLGSRSTGHPAAPSQPRRRAGRRAVIPVARRQVEALPYQAGPVI